ncbi:hypothetical protein V1477_017035 [Vespula maculifrons]|uniref:Uncharacterized protein n=2 Tax=Vespula TaxID=7451 RepID=A0A834N8J9_VESVU|nr:hypothetical protein HZH66_005969 [Vespula vulgaris]
MRTLVRTDCGSSEEEDEDGGGRDGSGSAPDEDPARSSRWRPTCSRSKDTQGCSANRRALKVEISKGFRKGVIKSIRREEIRMISPTTITTTTTTTSNRVRELVESR